MKKSTLYMGNGQWAIVALDGKALMDDFPRTSFLDVSIEISKHFDSELMNIGTTISLKDN